MAFVFAVVGMTGAPPASAAEDEFSVDVIVTGAEPYTGQVLVSLFDSAENYLKAPLLEVIADVDGEGKAFVALGKRAPGEYAVVVIYDKNENGKLDTGLFRIPREKIGYSNNARAKLGPARWNDTRFIVTDSDVNVDIQLAEINGDRPQFTSFTQGFYQAASGFGFRDQLQDSLAMVHRSSGSDPCANHTSLRRSIYRGRRPALVARDADARCADAVFR